MHRRFKKGVCIVKLIIILVWLIAGVVFLLSTCSQVKPSEKKDIKIGSPFESYTEDGLYYISDSIAHFVEAKTGKDIVLCSKPNCSHKRSPLNYSSICDAYLGQYPHFLFSDGKAIYFTSAPDTLDAGSVLYDKILYYADMDGKNRKSVTTLYGLHNINCMDYNNDLIALSYQKMNKIKPGEIVSSKLEKYITGIIIINLKTSDYIIVDEFEEYSANIYQIYFYDNKLYYYLFYTTEDLSNINKQEFSDINDYYEYISDKFTEKVISYDMDTKEKKLVWEGKNEFVYKQSGGYLLIEKSDKLLFLKGDLMVGEYNKKKLTDLGSEDMNLYVYNDVLYVFCKNIVRSMDINIVADGKLDGKGIDQIIAITGNTLYYEIQHEGNYIKYAIDKDDFFEGNLQKAKMIKK